MSNECCVCGDGLEYWDAYDGERRTMWAIAGDRSYPLCRRCGDSGTGRQRLHELAAERKAALTAEQPKPAFVDRNGVALKVGDTIESTLGSNTRCVIMSLGRDSNGLSTANATEGHHGNPLNLEKFWTRIDPPADEGKPVAYIALSGADVRVPITKITCAPHTRDSLIAALLVANGAPKPFDGYDDFEAERAAREVDDGLALIDRTVANLQRVHRMRTGELRYHTAGDCEP